MFFSVTFVSHSSVKNIWETSRELYTWIRTREKQFTHCVTFASIPKREVIMIYIWWRFLWKRFRWQWNGILYEVEEGLMRFFCFFFIRKVLDYCCLYFFKMPLMRNSSHFVLNEWLMEYRKLWHHRRTKLNTFCEEFGRKFF